MIPKPTLLRRPTWGWCVLKVILYKQETRENGRNVKYAEDKAEVQQKVVPNLWVGFFFFSDSSVSSSLNKNRKETPNWQFLLFHFSDFNAIIMCASKTLCSGQVWEEEKTTQADREGQGWAG